MALLVHTFGGYRRYWPGFVHGWKAWVKSQGLALYWVTDTHGELAHQLWKGVPQVTILTTRPGTWGARLKEALLQLPVSVNWVLYLQEDIWLHDPPVHADVLQQSLKYAQQHLLYHYKIRSGAHHLVGLPEDLRDPEWYIASHQPAWWNRWELMRTLRDTDSPFQHETRLNRELHIQPSVAAKYIACVNPPWYLPYTDVSRHGDLQRKGVLLLRKWKLPWTVNPDETMDRKVE